MKDLNKITLDNILIKYFDCISTDKLLEDNIDIDDTIKVEDSSQKYLQLFASFLNESYYRGYVISEKILKRLMNIIDYEGLEYLAMDKYQEILLNTMLDYKVDEDNRPKYREVVLSPEESKEFIMQYLKAVQESRDVPHFKNPGSTIEDNKDIVFKLLQEENYPVDLIYHRIKNHEIDNINVLLDFAYVIYKNNKLAYRSLIQTDKIKQISCFLLENTDNESLDILCNNINTLKDLSNLIKIYLKYMEITDMIVSDTVNTNIRRLIEILTINISIEQTAMIIGEDYDFWRSYCDNNYHPLYTLLQALNLYQSDPERFTMLNPISYIKKIKEFYNVENYHDAYFYARNCLLDMDIHLFCNNFETIYEELNECVVYSNLTSLISECIDGFVNLRNDFVDAALVNLYNRLSKYLNTNGNEVIYIHDETNGNRLETTLSKNLNIDNMDIKIIMCFIKDKLLNRNGKFNPDWIPAPDDDISMNYESYYIGDSINNNANIFNFVGVGSTFKDVRIFECVDNYTYEEAYFDEKFNECNRDNAIYIAKYLIKSEYEEITSSSNADYVYKTLLIVGDNNTKLVLRTPKLNIPGKYLIGFINTSTNEFTYGAYIKVNEDENVLPKLQLFSEQCKDFINDAEYYIIRKNIDNNVYFVDNEDYANHVIELSEELSESKKDIISLF